MEQEQLLLSYSPPCGLIRHADMDINNSQYILMYAVRIKDAFIYCIEV